MTIADQLREAAQSDDPYAACSLGAFRAAFYWFDWLDQQKSLYQLDQHQAAWFFLFVAEALEDE